MISVQQAQKIISNNYDNYRIGTLSLLDALGYILAENIISPDRLPRFDQAAMDGYALRALDTKTDQTCKLKIVGRIFSGDSVNGLRIRKNECAEISTGAPMPYSADAVLPLEEIECTGGFVHIKRKINKFENVRIAGEDVEIKKTIARKGDLITPQLTGLLSALGIVSVKTFLPPAVGIITTGSELIEPGKKINKYQIRNSNLIVIKALLKSLGIIPVFEKTFSDRKNVLYSFLKRLKNLPDIIIITGGVSVGSHDYVKEELEQFGVKRLFWRVSQKPGKPMYAGIRNKTLFFGLPGNPGAVMVCFYLYVLGVIKKYLQKTDISVPEIYAELENNAKNNGTRTLFLYAHYKNGRVQIFKNQGSHMLSSLARANSLVQLNPGESYKKGEKAKVLLF